MFFHVVEDPIVDINVVVDNSEVIKNIKMEEMVNKKESKVVNHLIIDYDNVVGVLVVVEKDIVNFPKKLNKKEKEVVQIKV